MVSIGWYLGFLKGQLGSAGMSQIEPDQVKRCSGIARMTRTHWYQTKAKLFSDTWENKIHVLG